VASSSYSLVEVARPYAPSGKCGSLKVLQCSLSLSISCYNVVSKFKDGMAMNFLNLEQNTCIILVN
jgi:hypothetical protein